MENQKIKSWIIQINADGGRRLRAKTTRKTGIRTVKNIVKNWSVARQQWGEGVKIRFYPESAVNILSFFR